ncbi:transmembrane anchor protein [Thalassospiraceae bacterium LMO-SO8]|nr:transmembrane anchor protein [Alphaproteobacteria bacterium LMO-S08]WND77025.1 transmembrane anchor protein [Thalassospiraceae bacterium LMO-SO8]
MFNSEIPSQSELPTTGRLLRSTFYALVSAAVILVTIVLPAEYAIDPTGIGRVLGLTEMGEIKTQLEAEAKADQEQTAAMEQQPMTPAAEPPKPSAPAQVAAPSADSAKPAEPQKTAEAQAPTWKEEISFTLVPGQGAEVKLVMDEGAVAEFHWSVDGGVANYDLHGDGGGKSIAYQKGRGVPGHEGRLEAAFTGNHGWFWRNRENQPIKVTLRVRGDYLELKRLI